MEISRLPEYIRKDLLETLEPYEDSKNLEVETAEQLFIRWCNWHGLINWGGRIISTLDILRKAEVDQPSTKLQIVVDEILNGATENYRNRFIATNPVETVALDMVKFKPELGNWNFSQLLNAIKTWKINKETVQIEEIGPQSEPKEDFQTKINRLLDNAVENQYKSFLSEAPTEAIALDLLTHSSECEGDKLEDLMAAIYAWKKSGAL